MVKIVWTKEESEKLKSLINNECSYETIQKEHFPYRTSNSLRLHAIRYLKIHNNYKHRDYSFDKDFWKISNMTNCYWGGFIATDGNVNNYCIRIELSSIDKEHLEKFALNCKSDNPIKTFKRNKGKFGSGEFSILQINTKNEWKEDLKNIYSIVPNKTHTLAPPNLLIKEYKQAYLKGYIDGDGSICLTNRGGKLELTINILGASLKMIEWIKKEIDEITHGCGARQKNREICSRTGYHQYGKSGLKACVLFDYLSQLPTPCLDRKWKKPEVLEYVSEQKQKYPDKFIKYIPQSVSLV